MRFLLRLIVNTLFPITCIHCGTYGTWWCAACRKTVSIDTRHYCPTCLRPGERHSGCPSTLDRLYVSGSYRNPTLARAIQTLKYQYSIGVVPALSERIVTMLKPALRTCGSAPIVVVPVPLHARRLRERGYNQAALTGERIAKALGVPFASDAITRVRNTRTQVGLDRARRLQNLDQAFFLTNPAKVQGAIILLIDDVTTTGVTLEQVGATLRKGRPGAIWGVTIASEAHIYKTKRNR